MNFKSIVIFLLSSIHIHLVTTKALLAVFDDSVVQGKSYPVEWLSDSEDYLQLLLVRTVTGSGWSAIETLFENRIVGAPGGNYTWDVTSNLTVGGGYGLWLQSQPVDPGNSTSGYADLTEWFDIRYANGSAAATTGLASTSTVTAAATGSTITSMSRSPTGLATTTTTAASQPTTTTVMDSTQSAGLSKPAIIGIAVGVSVAGITILAIFVLFFFRRRRHRRRSTQATPEIKIDDTDSETESIARPSFMGTTGTLAELPETGKTERVEVEGGLRQPVEKEGGGMGRSVVGKEGEVKEKENEKEMVVPKTVPPEKPVELE